MSQTIIANSKRDSSAFALAA
ncbi:protein of unknown function [Streptomyces sp. KY75]|nr:protein of unknown function [Streptomyces sp. KY75]CAD5982485.1 protein of unknown function [Streptomyces sp. KY70]